MNLRDINDDNDRLSGLGRVLEEQQPYSDYSTGAEMVQGGGVEFTPYEDVTTTTSAAPVAATAATPAEVVPTLSLPKFDFATGVASCTDCQSLATTSAAKLTAATEPKVTPLPAGPTTINWLLILAVGAVGYVALTSKGSAPLGCLPADTPVPVPTEVPLGRLPRRKPEKPAKLKHLDSLKIK